MEAALKSLWGASTWPFAAAVPESCATAAHEETLRRLEQCIAVHSSGVLHGPNGVGKSRLVESLVDRLPQKTYRTVVLSYLLAHRHGRDPLPVPICRVSLSSSGAVTISWRCAPCGVSGTDSGRCGSSRKRRT